MKNAMWVLMGATLMLAGCGTTTPTALDAQMGKSVEMARAQQTLKPHASLDSRPVETIDGKSADALVDRYHKGFETPTTTNIFNIGVGGGSTGSTLGATGGGSQ